MRHAWKLNSIWMAKDSKRGDLEAVIIGPGSKPNHKLVRMKYLNGVGYYGRESRIIEGEYSHRHMKNFFNFTGKIRAFGKDMSWEEYLKIVK